MKTMTIIPASESFRQFDSLFEQIFGEPRRTQPGTTAIPVDVLERDNALIIRATVPGIAPENLEIKVEKNVLTLAGSTTVEEVSEGTKVFLRERIEGTFSRSIRLPEGLNLEAAAAKFEHGVLTITLPKVEEVKPTAIHIPIQ